MQVDKTKALLNFLKNATTLRRKRTPVYGSTDRILWFANIPKNHHEIHSAFFSNTPTELPDLWLEVRKKRMPPRPSIPEVCKDWVNPQELDRIDQEPELLPEITLLVEKEVPDSDAAPREGRMRIEKVPEIRHLEDYPEIQDAWLEYLINQWSPWAQEMRNWQEVQRIYEAVDFMRRRLEEAEERYELILAVGLLTWRDPTGVTVKRHLLTAPAEIGLDAARGVLTVSPAASFDGFRIELDMLELQNRPYLEPVRQKLDELLEELDVQAWDRAKVGEILSIIANKVSPNAQIDEGGFEPPDRIDSTFRVVYAPALVLRERRPTAYEELISRILEDAATGPSLQTTQPWDQLISEGKVSENRADTDPEGSKSHSGWEDSRLYFPLPTNEEQRRIAERLQVCPYVLVKGPPGTGKSHTIANLICHLLATGQRILVTAYAPKALAVLKGLLPDDIRDLCVTTFGSTRDDQRLLESSVRRILSRKNEWKGNKWAQEKIAELEQELRKLEDEVAIIERELRTIREAETHSHILDGGYKGTAAQIARVVEERRSQYNWFPELSVEGQCPLDPNQISLLAEIHSQLTEEKLKELTLEVDNIPLPSPEEFEATVTKFKMAEQLANDLRKRVEEQRLEALRDISDDALQTLEVFLKDLEANAIRADRVLGQLTTDILGDLLVEHQIRWIRLAEDVAQLMTLLRITSEKVGSAQVQISTEISERQLLSDARRRFEHFNKGGWRGWWFLAPRVVRETHYIEKVCQVDGRAPQQPAQLEALVAFLETKAYIEEFKRIWPSPVHLEHLDPRQAVVHIGVLIQELHSLLKFFHNQPADVLAPVPFSKRVDLSLSIERENWLALIKAEMARRHEDRIRNQIGSWRTSLEGTLDSGSVHPYVQYMIEAIEELDTQKWKEAWRIKRGFKEWKERLHLYEKLICKLDAKCPNLGTLLRSTQGNPEWKDRLLQLREAWAWAAAKVWLCKVTKGYESLIKERQLLQEKIEKKIEELAALKAWQAFFDRLDNHTEQNLIAWKKAIARIGKGTGRHALKHRRTARKFLMACIPKIPAWIMPLHKVWESVDPQPGVFDTIIIDEASQAGIDALILLLLGKRIVVVGDDKQNSPEAVGILEDDITRLAREHLRDFYFCDEFRPDTSLYDHAERAFRNVISLREHFRCVPEIIRFSNDLCYTDTPLIPLRQPSPNRLQPLKATFVKTGSCEGKGQRIINRAEAEEIVAAVQECLNDKAYKGKTMGVIVLQGRAQAEYIEQKLAEVLEPKILEERKLRCGVPATFQGDQRDVIFLSLIIAPNHHFRALTEIEAQRRFNVAMSRARDQVWLFHSVQLHDLSREDLRWRLLNFFYNPAQEALEGVYEELDRLEREAKRPSRRPGNQPEPYESWFEVDVALELLRRKYRLRPQVEVADYRIDLVIEGLNNRLAIECDGDRWHGPERYDYDIARQRQLERAGWRFVRIRESEFYADRAKAVYRIIEACKELGIRPVEEERMDQDPATIAATSKVRSFDDKQQGHKDVYTPLHRKSTGGTQSGRDWQVMQGQERRPRRFQRLQRGIRTPEEAFRRPILEALVELGGRAPINEVLKRVETKMNSILNVYDLQPLPSNPTIIRWQNTARWCRSTMVREGFLKNDSPRGIWEISERGREALQKNEV